MVSPPAQHRCTIDEYLRLERDALDKHEFHDGEILAMSGGSPAHSLLAANVARAVGNRLKKGCRIYDSNLRIRIRGTQRYLYPDATVICGALQFDEADSKSETVTNPRVVIEVLSPSTERYDRTKQFDFHRQSPTLEEYILVSQDISRIEVYHRQADGNWLFSAWSGKEAVAAVHCLGIQLPLSEVYDGLDVPAELPEPKPDKPD